MELDRVLASLAPRVLRFSLGWTADPALAEEVAQEALAALVGRWRRHGPPDEPAAFVLAIARRRARRAVFRRSLLRPLSAMLDGAAPGPGSEEVLLQRAELRRTVEAMRHLPTRDREALLLVALGELSLEESSRVLSVSVPALKMRVHRARIRLRELLAPAGEECPDESTTRVPHRRRAT